ncbi:hypothetical protein OPT61_g8236 [Boeremia exigua]|uniref:Uncharacterized protein n=1 Tax=Boeremia exigua TaxID=749465 RepID=A0ACC2HZH9_9PLEO|nr:hypothetical protein OPT61_g8236 [Boeremia exigua]
MPKGWFFEIHEDTPEQEAANLMEHSASVLDISSGDDAETKARLEELSRGKENVPPPDFALTQPRSASTPIDDGEETEIEEPAKRPRTRKPAPDAMDQDRTPLADLPPNDFYAHGCDASSYVTVDAGIERPSRLSKEVDLDDENVEPVKKVASKQAPAPKRARSKLAMSLDAPADPAPAPLAEATSQQ